MKTPFSSTGSWSPSAWFCAESSHVWAAASIVLAFNIHGYNPLYVVWFLIGATFLKEFVADLTFLEHDTLSGSTQDWSMWIAGSLVGLTACVGLWSGIYLGIGLILCLMISDMLDQGLVDANPYD